MTRCLLPSGLCRQWLGRVRRLDAAAVTTSVAIEAAISGIRRRFPGRKRIRSRAKFHIPGNPYPATSWRSPLQFQFYGGVLPAGGKGRSTLQLTATNSRASLNASWRWSSHPGHNALEAFMARVK